jgi:hypothetical protein
MGAAEKLPTNTPTRSAFVAEIADLWHRGYENIRDIGRKLNAAKDALAHGEFEAMIENDLPFTASYARRFMRVARDPRFEEGATLHALPAMPGVALMDNLRKLPDTFYQAAVEDGRIHPKLTVKESFELLKQAGGGRKLNQRPHALVEPRAPAIEEVATCYPELVWLLTQARKSLGVSQEEIVYRSNEIFGVGNGFEDGYLGKLEQPGSDSGRNAVHPLFDVWLAALGIGLKVVRLADLKAAA